MKYNIDPGRARKSLTMLDNIIYSPRHQLDLSLVMQHGNVESRLANGINPEVAGEMNRKPVIIWVPGGGYRGGGKNLMVPEMSFLAEAGFAVASISYRGTGVCPFPAQIEDVLTAVRFLREHADIYNLDEKRIGIMGRSAGGHLAALAGMNSGLYETDEWSGQSSEVQAVCNWFGSVDVPYLLEKEEHAIAENPDYRFKRLEDTHPGALMGGETATMKERSKEASPPYCLGTKICPLLMMHGDQDRHVPTAVSDNFYCKLVEAGYGDQTEYYIIKNGNHGSDEFFQPVVKNIVKEFFKRVLAEPLKKEADF